MKILLVLPAGEQLRVTPQKPELPRRAMLRFSVLPLTVVAALTPREYQVRIVDENVKALETAAVVTQSVTMSHCVPSSAASRQQARALPIQLLAFQHREGRLHSQWPQTP